VSHGRRWPLPVAEQAAEDLIALLRPHCERIQAAGSVRRRCDTVGDLEIVLQPRFAPLAVQGDLFGPESSTLVNLAWAELDRLTKAGRLPAPVRGGERYRCYPETADCPQVDVFAVLDPGQWGPILAIRTGPARYSGGLMAGLKRYGLRMDGGWLCDGRGRIHCESEETFLLAHCREPEYRLDPRNRQQRQAYWT